MVSIKSFAFAGYFFSKRFIDKGYMVNFAQDNRFLKAFIETTY